MWILLLIISGAAVVSGELCPAGKYHKLYGHLTPQHTFGDTSCMLQMSQQDCMDVAVRLNKTYTFMSSSGNVYPPCFSVGDFVYYNEMSEEEIGSYAWQACRPSNSFECFCKNDTCISCEVGMYNDEPNQSTCKDCEAGQYQDQTGESSCSICPLGKGSEPGQELCGCPEGYYVNVTAISGCTRCSPGRWAPAGSSQCTDIPDADIAHIVKPPAEETIVGYMVSTSPCGQLTPTECQAAAVSLGKDFGFQFNNQFNPANGIVEWDTMSTGCVQSGQDWLYFNTHAGNDKCDDTNYCKHVCKVPKCAHDTKDACTAVNGCWWHGDKCTEGCDQRAKDLDNRICGSTKTQLEEEYRQLNQC